jgi:hypothetical protein
VFSEVSSQISSKVESTWLGNANFSIMNDKFPSIIRRSSRFTIKVTSTGFSVRGEAGIVVKVSELMNARVLNFV